jgi:basic membrane protein A and related proteins
VKRYPRLLAIFAVLGLVIAACGNGDAEDTTTTAADVTTTTAADVTTTTADDTTTTEPMTDVEPVVTCLVTDLAGVDDRSFNAAAWQGVLDAVSAGFAAENPILLESDAQADYQPNIDQCLTQGAEHIVTVGFELGDATATNAEANPDVLWTIVDFGYDPDIDNVRELLYQTDEAAFAAGYLAAGVTQTGIVGTYGGLNIPTVSIFMDGFARGVEHYNELKGTDVRVVGWDIDAQDGSFTGSFNPADPVVRTTCESILDEGADIVLPVGGAINIPCGTAIQDRNIDAALVGVDQDAVLAMPAELADLWLTTIEKGIAIQVLRSIQDHAEGTWTAGGEVGNLANGAVGLSPYHAWEDRVPAELDAEVQQILEDIAAGVIDAAVFPVG